MEEPEKTVVTVGMFSSLHLGHRKLIEKAVEKAKLLGVRSCVFTFDTSLEKHKGGTPFLNPEEKTKLLKSMGADEVYVRSFDENFRNLEPKQFVKEILKEELSACSVIVGENFRFGKNASGDADLLKKLCTEEQIECEIIPLEKDENGRIISTTLLRSLAESGDIKTINKLTGRPFTFKGIVIQGRHDGRKIGFPTVNISLENLPVVPKHGVYVSRVEINGVSHQAITNIGKAPTFGCEKELAETHIIGVDANLYGKYIEVCLLERIRDVSPFSTVEKLIEQLEKDKKTAIEYKNNI